MRVMDPESTTDTDRESTATRGARERSPTKTPRAGPPARPRQRRSPWSTAARCCVSISLASGPLLWLAALVAATVPPATRSEDAPAPPQRPALAVATVPRQTPVDFESEILPAFRRNCLACHNQTRAKGELILETPQSIRQGGASGPSVVEGRGAESLLFRAASHRAEDMIMPPAGNKANAENLSAHELGLLKLWIDQGATGEVHGIHPVDWQPMPAGWQPAFATAITPDGQIAAVSRAHRIELYLTASQRSLGALMDAQHHGAAHRDIVNALAFSPDGQRLASAGYREIKLWRRQPLSAGFVERPHSGSPAAGLDAAPGTNDARLQPLVSQGEAFTVAAVSTDATLAATAGTPGLIKIWRLDSPPALLRECRGDGQLEREVAVAEQELSFAQSEVEYHRGTRKRLEDEVKKAEEALAKSTEKHATHEKALAGKKDERAQQEKAKSDAEKEHQETTAALNQANQAAADAARVSLESKTKAKAAQEKSMDSRLAAEQAARAKADLDRLVADLAGKTEEGAVQKARELAATAAADAANKFKDAESQRLEAEKQLEALASRAFESGAAKSAADRAQGELPPKIKIAEERAAAAIKALADLDGQIKKAEIAVTTAAGDLDLSRHNLDSSRLAFSNAVAALAQAETSHTNAVAVLASTTQTRDAHAAEPVRFLAFSPGATRLIAATAAGRLRAWLASDGSPVEAWTSVRAPILAVRWMDDERVAVDTATGTETFQVQPKWTLERTLGGDVASSPWRDRVTALAFSPDGTELVSGGGEASRGGEVIVWPLAEGSRPRDLGARHSDTVLAAAYSPAGDQILTGGADRFARLLDAASGKVLRQFEGHTHHVLGVAWLRSGRAIATAGADGVVKLWNPVTGERSKNVDGFGKEVVGVGPVGTADQWVAASGTGQVRWFNLAGEKLRQHDGAGTFLHALAITPDGRWTLAGDADGVLRIWSGSETKPMAELHPEPDPGITLSR